MPRTARRKDPTAIYHIMAHSISEFNLYPDNLDKEYFLDVLKKYKEKYDCRIYAYCLMSNHYHILIDTNGYDISNFMKSLNQAYVRYINRKYSRKGHLLTERFNSKIIESDEYLLAVSAYIHSNPKDLPEYNGREFSYPYSSMCYYLGKTKDSRHIVDTDFILGCINESGKDKAIKAYEAMVIERKEAGINKKLKEYLDEFKAEQYEYKSYREVIMRDMNPEKLIRKIAEKLKIDDIGTLSHRWKRKSMRFRSLTAYMLNNYCGLGINEIAKRFKNISASCCFNLCNRGYDICSTDKSFMAL